MSFECLDISAHELLTTTCTRCPRWPGCPASRTKPRRRRGPFPVAYTQGVDFGPAPRRPVREIIRWSHRPSHDLPMVAGKQDAIR